MHPQLIGPEKATVGISMNMCSEARRVREDIHHTL